MAEKTNDTGGGLKELTEQECLGLISPGGIGRVAFSGAHGPTVLPVNYRVIDGAIVFRTRAGGAMDNDLRTDIKDLDIKIAFQVDEIDKSRHEGWSVLVQGPAHHVEANDTAFLDNLKIETWAGGERDHYVRIIPSRITGRRVGAL